MATLPPGFYLDTSEEDKKPKLPPGVYLEPKPEKPKPDPNSPLPLPPLPPTGGGFSGGNNPGGVPSVPGPDPFNPSPTDPKFIKPWFNPNWDAKDKKMENEYLYPPGDSSLKPKEKKKVKLPMIYAFTPINAPGYKVKSIWPFKPKDVEVDKDGVIGITGFFGFDAFPGCTLKFLINREYITVTMAEIPEEWDNLIEFTPDPALVREFIIETFDTLYIIEVKADYTAWVALIQELVKKDLNEGWGKWRF